jgi:hypothetical protein
VGRVKAETIIVPHTLNPEWNKVFAIGEDGVQGSTVEVTVWDAVHCLLPSFSCLFPLLP